MPEISDVSYRQADAMLQSLGLSVSNVEYSASEYKDLVIDVKYHGRSILQGTRIPEGSSVVLVVGNGLGEAQASVPSLKGLGLDEATQEITSASLEVGSVTFDVPPSGDEDKYIIYRQRPAAGSSISSGDKIDIYLSKDKARMKEVFEEDKKKEDTDEQFF
jgi:beta-lactam-binding protein with PASTA domain